ncbi:1-deoxy-D-xylulose-5-phosphate reductoisomerase [Rudanella paleaurantiibacter]|uniref:1-deoxy-D-xylulose 5-phosphate reductoisomerase n=1 Tax=Rudanella paleaurantiibacter TaxID=2614655 RepID=A0A7J5TXG9_9BACT|nr:1-deoxy-D-xylulose-5-phosphate reductoisomerase [Rudanella paleaurantiibacter]KAB7729338.1 1-deoxy-D-xylulose-5-phosphate reductoisomerase [Rudanella paleaurantiibacter]
MYTDSNKRHIAILGSTGSIGTQAIDVVRAHPDQFVVEVLTANSNADLLIQQAELVRPNVVVICDESRYDQVFAALDPLDIKVYAGAASVASVVQMDSIDMVLTAMVGYAGLLPTIRAIEAGKHIALANKETLVVAGELITRLAAEKGVNIYPVDSEHSAIFQCLVGEFHNPIEKIVLTASGGPFRGKDRAFLETVTKAQALKHPNWSMGAKITIDSATLMNKGLEVIEAKWLFGLTPEQIEVIVHPQSIIHSLVQFEDGSMKAQMGLPDMRLPIQFALGYPNRLKSDFPRFDFRQFPSLTFEQPDLETFRNLQLAFDALRQGGNAPCIINAANEVAVDAFLHERLSFLGISDVIAECLATATFVAAPTYDDYVSTDTETRRLASERIKSLV